METLRHFVAVLYVLVFATLVLSRDIIGNEILPVCPRQDNPNGNATILPDPQNCTTFFICSNGQAYQFVCPSQLKVSRTYSAPVATLYCPLKIDKHFDSERRLLHLIRTTTRYSY